MCFCQITSQITLTEPSEARYVAKWQYLHAHVDYALAIRLQLVIRNAHTYTNIIAVR